MNWKQIGDDFAQKYDGTYCRYLSPITKDKEVFRISNVIPRSDSPPDIILRNNKVGELYLNYNTEVELDFSFPEIGYFQHNDKAFIFQRNYIRQWRKGIGQQTATTIFPYSKLYPMPFGQLSEELLGSAFLPKTKLSFTEAHRQLLNGKAFSVVLNKLMSLGLGETKGIHWLWLDDYIIGEVKAGLYNVEVSVSDQSFVQEVQDHIRDTRDVARIV